MSSAETRYKARVLITGGAGYVGSCLVARLLEQGYFVRVLDLCLYGTNVFGKNSTNPHLDLVCGDIRDTQVLQSCLKDIDSVIHLACISNDPSFELDPQLGKSINYDAFEPLIALSRQMGVSRFIYASSSSVYGVKKESHVSEDLSLEPLTDYSKYKAMCEDIVHRYNSASFPCLILRPATVCGFAPRLRLDLTVNILSNHAFHRRVITIFGGKQLRPNIHVEDMAKIYELALEKEAHEIQGKTYNAGYENYSVEDIAKMVQKEVGEDVSFKVEPSNDLRSYHISSQRLHSEWNFTPRYSIQDAVRSLKVYFEGLDRKKVNTFEDPKFFNIKMMQKTSLACPKECV